MRAPQSLLRAGLTAASVAAVLFSGCARGRHRDSSLASPDCVVAVLNRTPHILEIRVGVRPLTTVAIGALNPGELLHHSVPCVERGVWVAGVPVPDQVGAPVFFRLVQGSADLVEGQRAEVALHWP